MHPIRGLLIDFGGVLTSSLGEAFERFCEEEGIPPDRLRDVLRAAYDDEDPDHFVSLIETGRIEIDEFERLLAEVLSDGLQRPIRADGLVRRMVEDMEIDPEMVDLVRRARAAGIRTALVSNSWGLHYYPMDLLEEIFDAILISGEVGLRKPGPEIFRAAAERLGLDVAGCVFVDDFGGNVAAAERLGMRGYLHEESARSVKELETLLGLPPAAAESDLRMPRGAWARRH
ncbi:MAG TPA: HAD family phosphatase, partial [Actinomycetota bacterium]|nr:HAD family phosphatase [Actinomycetota bacterium]